MVSKGWLLGLAALMVLGCGGGGGAPLGQTVGYVRVIHAGERLEKVDAFVEGALIGPDMEFGRKTPYVAVLPGRRQVTIASDARRVTLGRSEFDVARERWDTVFVSGSTAAPVIVPTTDVPGPSGAFVNVKVLNAVTDLAALDVVLRPTGGTAPNRPQFDDVPTATVTRPLTLAAGEYTLCVATGNESLALLEQSGVQLVAGKSYTAVVTTRGSGTPATVAVHLFEDRN